ncbi:MAG: DUF4843 domain-containing protein [Bacteroidales bacterium]|nr:DUF4843 domain-containing protein [Bacteroidales bacterium]MDE6872815.1 DUF4843 domain-containing protein [Bacteroidales bacterium]MDE7126475.1 DUF4843 domain-containing protein [Bacteroidales bacterium]
MKTKKGLYIACILSVLGCISCTEQHPRLFEELNGIYFNYKSGGLAVDSTSVTFVYESGSELDIPVTVQLLGRPSAHDRNVSVTVSSGNAEEGIDYVLPESSVLPAGEVSFQYTVKLLRTEALKSSVKDITLELHANEDFTLPVSVIEQTTGNIEILTFRIRFSDMFTDPPAAWSTSILGGFSQQKFELICKVLSIDPAMFNNPDEMTLAKQAYIFTEMTYYIKNELAKMEAGLEYDHDIIDKETGLPIAFPTE